MEQWRAVDGYFVSSLVRRFFEQVAADPRLEATALQTVGARGWDGFAVARVR